MTPESPIHRLSIIGFWSDPTEGPERSRGRPDPRDLTREWTADDRRDVLAHLRRGKVFRTFAGLSRCRICDKPLGSRELTDGVWAWPEGLDHYVETHATHLPEAFVTAARHASLEVPAWVASLGPDLWLESGEPVTPMNTAAERTWIVDESTWLDWAAANTPARPARDAATLEEAREVCGRLSHSVWRCEVDEARGRWVMSIGEDGGATRIYLQKCSAAVLEHRLLSLRIPDPMAILDHDRSDAIAAEYDGAWGGARVVGVHPEAWLVWVKGSTSGWPTDAEIDKAVDRELKFGWTTFYPGGGKCFIIPPADEVAWRWLLSREREKGQQELGGDPPGPRADGRPSGLRGLARWWLAVRTRLFHSPSPRSR